MSEHADPIGLDWTSFSKSLEVRLRHHILSTSEKNTQQGNWRGLLAWRTSIG
jgi:hypothetical protein